MPVATVTKTTERYELKSLPEAFVVIRRMNYGEKLNRQDEMINMRTGGNENGSSFAAEIKLMNKKVALQDFASLIIDHNLTDENDRPLNLKNPSDVLMLDPRIGDEIGQLIDNLNSFEGTESVKN
jgi:hypothetical protein